MLDSRVDVGGILSNRANPLMARPILKTRTVTDAANSIHVHTVGLVVLGSNQVVLSSTSPTSDADAAAPDVDVPSPFALSGASPSLHARHEEQRFLFLFESFEWLHQWHGHDKARRVSDRSVGILLREASWGFGTQKTRQEDHTNSYQ